MCYPVVGQLARGGFYRIETLVSRAKRVASALSMMRGPPLEAGAFEVELPEQYAPGSLTITQVLALLEEL